MQIQQKITRKLQIYMFFNLAYESPAMVIKKKREKGWIYGFLNLNSKNEKRNKNEEGIFRK